MIPAAHLQQWAAIARWPERRQVEQDLVISRSVVDLFTAPGLADKIAFRGGTAIHKLLFSQPLRYSEDIDLVQLSPEPIGETIDAIRRASSIVNFKSWTPLEPNGFGDGLRDAGP